MKLLVGLSNGRRMSDCRAKLLSLRICGIEMFERNYLSDYLEEKIRIETSRTHSSNPAPLMRKVRANRRFWRYARNATL